MKIEPVKYEITDVGHPYPIYLENRGDDSWAITDFGMCMSKLFYFENEPMPSSRSEEWLKEFRFTFNEAIEHLEDLSRKNKHHQKNNFNLDTGSQI